MPRNKVDPLHRRRVARACDSCKRRKERCNGATPCEQCKSRHREESCQYTGAQASSLRRPLLREGPVSSNHSDIEAHRALCVLEDLTPAENLTQDNESFLTSAPVPKNSRMLQDSKGKFSMSSCSCSPWEGWRVSSTFVNPTVVYIGESASLSFLQTIRRAVTAALGPCEFTTDTLRHRMIETAPPVRFDSVQEPSFDLEEAISLAHQFFLIASGILDFFDRSWLIDELPTWIEDPLRKEQPKSPIIYLALAIGAQGRAQDEADEIIAEKCFGFGRQLAVLTLMDDPSLLTVQAFTLITYYMLSACRRNGGFTNLGVAVRAAYALGIHRHETNISFVSEEGIARERAWKTLRVCDLFLSASMGRPPATSDTDCNIPWASLDETTDKESSTISSQVNSAIFRICHVFERILVEVYSRRSVSLELAGSISRQHREWTEKLPRMLKIDRLDEPSAEHVSGMSHRLGSAIVIIAYYYSIILLSRPFLTFKVCHHSSATTHGDRSTSATSPSADLTTYADACVDSAIKGIDVAHGLVFEENMPKRQPLVINSVFVSTLCLGLAYLDDYDRRGWPLGQSLERGIAILRHFGRLNPQSARYADICHLLQAATASYIDKRNNAFLRSSSQQVRNVFGDVQDSTAAQPQVLSGSRIHATQPQPAFSRPRNSVTEPMSPSSFDGNIRQPEAMMTTPGVLSSSYHRHRQDASESSSVPLDFFIPNNELSPGDWQAGENFPLFFLTNEVPSEAYIW